MLCLVGGAEAAVPVLKHVQLERRLSAAASTLTPFPVRIRCQTAGATMRDAHGDLGHVRFDADGIPEHEALATYEPCGDAAAWLASGSGRAAPEQVVAVHVLTHETVHMLGETGEAKTECLAVQRDQAMAVALGASRSRLRHWPAGTGRSWIRGCRTTTAARDAVRDRIGTSEDPALLGSTFALTRPM